MLSGLTLIGLKGACVFHYLLLQASGIVVPCWNLCVSCISCRCIWWSSGYRVHLSVHSSCHRSTNPVTRLARIPEWGTASMRIHTWRNIFFFEGLITVIVGLCAPFVMPTTPGECWFLTERERRIAAERLVAKGGAEENEKVEFRHLTRSFMNINNYICALGFFLINITVQGISLFMVSDLMFCFLHRANSQCSQPFSEISAGLRPKLSSTRYRHTFAPAPLLFSSHMFLIRPTAEASISQGLCYSR